jgi:hypothetical protein
MPKFLTSDPTDHMHALTIRDPNEPTQMVILRLALQGVTLLLNSLTAKPVLAGEKLVATYSIST